ncbi:MAG: cysteine hydrolase family protein [Paracoccaceae bacterium]|nr:cysteine hydrolase family protein [Paracoccaceae bacterium]
MPQTALLVIDLQMEFALRAAAGKPRSTPQAEAEVAGLLALFRARGLPVLHVHHDDPHPKSGFRLGTPGGAVMPCAAPVEGEAVFVKHGSSAFVGTGLADHLHTRGISRLVVVGAAADYCVSSTVRMGSDLGFRMVLVPDAVFGFGTKGPDGQEHDAETVLSVTLGALGGFARLAPAAAVANLLD